MPREVETATQFSKEIKINIPLVSAAMDTVTEAKLAISVAQSGGIDATANYRKGPPGGGGRGLTGDNKKIIEENTNVRDALYRAELEFNKNNDLYFEEVILLNV